MPSVLIVRHAIALEREIAVRDGISDAHRPLTEEGRKRMRRQAEGLQRLVPTVTSIACSALLRARETAEILTALYTDQQARELEALNPGGRLGDILEWIHGYDGDPNPLVLVGHEPDLSELVGWLLSAEPRSLLRLRKGGACLVELPSRAKPGDGVLEWALAPKQLRLLVR